MYCCRFCVHWAIQLRSLLLVSQVVLTLIWETCLQDVLTDFCLSVTEVKSCNMSDFTQLSYVECAAVILHELN